MSDDIKKQLFILMAQAEEQQKNMDKTLAAIKEQQSNIENLNNDLPRLAQELFKNSLNDARASLEGDLSNYATKTAQDLKKASSEAIRAADAIKQEREVLGWKIILVLVGGIFVIALAVIISVMLYVPSLDDIAERRETIADLDSQNGNLDISRCEGELCVRVMTKTCEYGPSKDYCILDLKD